MVTGKNKKRKGNSTDLLLGELIGKVGAVEVSIGNQDGSIKHFAECLSGLTRRLDKLPCDVHAERLEQITAWREESKEEETYGLRIKKKGRRELLIAVVSALLAGTFTIIGVWIALQSSAG